MTHQLEALEPRVLLSVTINSDGFTQVTPGTDSRVIYVSSSSGRDGNNGLSASAAVQTLSKAVSLVRDGMPDQILLKRGDVWYESLGNWTKSGRSANAPMLISSYGSGDRPILRTGTSSALTTSINNTVSNVAIIGLDFHAHTRDPDFSSSFSASGSAGIRWFAAGENLLLEDIRVTAYRDNIVMQSENGFKNFQLRHSQIIGAYTTSGHSQGLYVKGVNGILLEGNLFDHNGWNPKVSGAHATIFNHNVYIQTVNSNLIARDNIFSRASSHGIQARIGGIIENNFFIDNPIGMTFGTVLGGSVSKGTVPANGVSGRVVGNVFHLGGDISPNLPRGVGLDLGNINSAVVRDNVFTQDAAAGTAVAAIYLSGDNGIGLRDLMIRDNVIHNWSQGVRAVDGTYRNVTVRDNTFHDDRSSADSLIRVSTSGILGNITFSNNQYATTRPGSAFRIGGYTMDLTTWKRSANDNGTMDADLSFADEQRDIRSYNQSLGRSGGVGTFMQQARRVHRMNLNPNYASTAVNTYFQQGLNLDGQVTLPAVSVSTSSPRAYEQDERAADFILHRSGDRSGSLTVSYTLSGTATNGVDYQALTGTAVFAAGSATARVTVQPIDDDLMEGNETVILTLVSSGTYKVSGGSATITIVDNDRVDDGDVTDPVTESKLIITDSSGDPLNRQLGLAHTEIGERSWTERFTITNTGNDTVMITNFAIGGPAPDDFEYRILNNSGRAVSGSEFAIGAGESFRIEVTFVPTAAGSRVANFTFNTTDPGDAFVRLGFAGLGLGEVSSTPQPALEVLDSSGDPLNRQLGLATTEVGQRSWTGTFTLNNHGEDVLEVTNFAIGGAHAGDFEYRLVDANGRTITGDSFNIAVGESVTIRVNFLPTAGGSRVANFTFNTTDPGDAFVRLGFAGLGLGEESSTPQPALEVLDSSGDPLNRQLGLATTEVGQRSWTGTFTLNNHGEDLLEVTNFAIGGAHAGDFEYRLVDANGRTITGDSFNIAVGESVTIRVNFLPTAGGSRVANFTFDTNDPDESHVTLGFAGLGVATAQPSLEVLDSSGDPLNRQIALSTTWVGQRSWTGTFTLNNHGEGVLEVSDFAMGGLASGDFEFHLIDTNGRAIRSNNFAIEPGESVTIRVTFVPTAGGSRMANFTFNTNDPNESQVTLGFTGLALR